MELENPKKFMEPKESKKPRESREPEQSKGLMRGRKSKDPREP